MKKTPEEDKEKEEKPASPIRLSPPPTEEMKAKPVVSPPISTPERSKRGYANKSSIDNTLNLGAKLYNQMAAVKRQKEGIPTEAILDQLKRKISARGPKGIIGLLKQFRVNIFCGNNKLNSDDTIYFRYAILRIRNLYRSKSVAKYLKIIESIWMNH